MTRLAKAHERLREVLLPGYPVSCLMNAVQFLRPTIAWQVGTEPASVPDGQTPDFPRRADVRPRPSRGARGGAATVKPVRVSGAGVMSSVTLSDGWVEIPESKEGLAERETVDVQTWE